MHVHGATVLQQVKRLTLLFCFQLVASIVFISFGVVAAFCCAIVDGVFAARHIVSAYTMLLYVFLQISIAVKALSWHLLLLFQRTSDLYMVAGVNITPVGRHLM